ncbi:hypothetical protein SXBG_00079 [Synechococcus phage S-CAM1]|jgi:hypothetical protein|uniref:Uncharacterized protein n=1 Tax=Synechococcus phage S-CAM1 TaxID=754037 RepID=M4QHB6_9CAUD|nr:hypothetical protein SXBG_00079 [Synechococcus phage S-CAM1]AGH26816.1 hypothetical protein SXBG_00079 [Synechococcus phage S-CAM1]AOV57268.1 hypothetical protein N330309_013 [Synechococcus phage S-CAM1]AOV57518.1 hypothetical protein N170310_013 [Synechococcus phage S-CAM1]AOV57768.1 hypothetical protein C030809_013 [Synechococcus phage S-CAM1]AOV58018.1 hypothetical protein S170810_013 [Synechococcus phage S-CAM1]
MHYKPYSPEWHRYRYLKESLELYFDNYVETQIIMDDILNIISERQQIAHAEYSRMSDLEEQLRE